MKVTSKPVLSENKVLTLDLETKDTHTYQLKNGVVSHNSTSCILGSASGIHPHHSRRYFRRIQANKLEAPFNYFKSINPDSCENSVWSAGNTDEVVTFCVEVPAGAKTKMDTSAIDLLEYVKSTYQNWVIGGTRENASTAKWLTHNVSNTISVNDDEWEEVTKYIYDNRKWFAGVSLLPGKGDLDYPQAPFCKVSTPREILKTYGESCMMASGLIVDGNHAFDGNLWRACDAVIKEDQYPQDPKHKLLKDRGLEEDKMEYLLFILSKEEESKLVSDTETYQSQIDWVRRVRQFAERYCDGDDRKCTYLMKEVHNWKSWLDLKRTYKDVDFSDCVEETDETKHTPEWACSGGQCELV